MAEQNGDENSEYKYSDAVIEAHELFTNDIQFNIKPLALKMLKVALTSVGTSGIIELAFDRDLFDRPEFEFVRPKRIDRNLENLEKRSVLSKDEDGLYSFDSDFLWAFMRLVKALLENRKHAARNEDEIFEAISEINALIHRGKPLDYSNVISITTGYPDIRYQGDLPK